MSSPRKLVLDANIPVRAVFGKKVYGLLKQYEDLAEFYALIIVSRKLTGICP